MEWKAGNKYVLTETCCAPFSEEVCKQGDVFKLIEGGLFENVSTKRTYAFPKTLMREHNPKPEMLVCDRSIVATTHEPSYKTWQTKPGEFYEVVQVLREEARIKSANGISWVPKSIFPALRGKKKENPQEQRGEPKYITIKEDCGVESYGPRRVIYLKKNIPYKVEAVLSGMTKIEAGNETIWIGNCRIADRLWEIPDDELWRQRYQTKNPLMILGSYGDFTATWNIENANKKDEQKMEQIKLEYKGEATIECSGCDLAYRKLNQFGYCASCWADLSEEDRVAMAGIKIVDRVVVEKRETVTQLLPTPGAWKTALLGAGLALLTFSAIMALVPQVPFLKAYFGL